MRNCLIRKFGEKKTKTIQMARIIIDHGLYLLKICFTLSRKRKTIELFLKKNLKYIIISISYLIFLTDGAKYIIALHFILRYG